MFPLLFVIVMEALGTMISAIVSGDLLSGFSMGQNVGGIVVCISLPMNRSHLSHY
jgi:hypothetical protein